jgi:hypothetical protein
LPDKIVISFYTDPAKTHAPDLHLHHHTRLHFPSSPTKNTWVSNTSLEGKISYVVLQHIHTNTSSETSATSSKQQHQQQPPSVTHIEQPMVLVNAGADAWNPGNYGHAYMDYIFSTYVGAKKLNRSISDFTFLPITSRSGRSTDDNFKKFQSYLTLVNSTLNVQLASYGKETLCFSELLVPGYYGLYRDNTAAVTQFSRGLRDLVYSLHPPIPSFHSPAIVLAYKNKKTLNKKKLSYDARVLLNKAEVNESLSARFGRDQFAMHDLGEVSIPQQVSLLRGAAVFVSPLGGASFAALLLPDNAVFLQIDSYNFELEQSECLIIYECRIYDSLQHIRVLRHHIHPYEMTNSLMNTVFKPPNRPLYLKLMGNFILDASSLGTSIDHALTVMVMANDLQNDVVAAETLLNNHNSSLYYSGSSTTSNTTSPLPRHLAHSSYSPALLLLLDSTHLQEAALDMTTTTSIVMIVLAAVVAIFILYYYCLLKIMKHITSGGRKTPGKNKTRKSHDLSTTTWRMFYDNTI